MGLINFPTRFLRWIKIDGDAEGDDGGGSGGGGDSGDNSFDNKKFGNDVAEKYIQYSEIEVPENYLEPDCFLFNEYDYNTDSYIPKTINSAEDFAFCAIQNSVIPVYEENPYNTELRVQHSVQDDEPMCMVSFLNSPIFTWNLVIVSSVEVEGKTYYVISNYIPS